ncbi:MAG: FAD-dependent oxidoreductase [Vicingaceae bacterium]
MDTPKLDAIIVGQGLAGTCLAYQFLKRGKKVLVYDMAGGKDCSAIAAGTFNPIVFRTFSTTWRAKELVPYLKSFYEEIAQFIKGELLTPRRVIKGMKSEDQRDLWVKKSAVEPGLRFMNPAIKDEIFGLRKERGYGLVIEAGTIDIKLLMTGLRNKLMSLGMLAEKEFDLNGMKVESDDVTYENVRAERIIFCQGYLAAANPYFAQLPIIPNKGEALVIECPDLTSNDIVHNRINIVPYGNHRYWVGATFDWKTPNLETSEEARNELKIRLDETLEVPYRIVDQIVGIRPTVSDRRPIIGFLEDQPEIGIFNGMGARGVMLAPFFSDHFLESMYSGIALDPEVDIRRFNAKG